MRLTLDPRAERLLRRLPRVSVYSLSELLLLCLLAWQCARLFWVLVTPVDPLGDWRGGALAPDAAASRQAIGGGFDPFFRLNQSSGTAAVTSLQLVLFGIRVDEAIGRGSAIIAGPDGIQTSYGVGDAIQPGVVLKAVNFDNVVIDRGGADETLFLDQSTPAPVAQPTGAPVTETLLGASPVAAGQAVTIDQLQSDIGFAPRNSGGRVTGFVVRSQGPAFQKAGFRDGDILVQVNGRPVTSPADIQRATAGVASGGAVPVSVERGADIVPIAIQVSGR